MESDNETNLIEAQMEYVSQCLHEAEEWRLTAEIVTDAIKIAQQNPDWTVSQCLEQAMSEWIK